jgi:succinate dehydrogenase/fumarate reductase-like Fe-S protein
MPVVRHIGALAFLGYRAIVVHPLHRLMQGRSRQGPKAFLKNYAHEGLVPISVEEREQLPSFMKCVGCGLCDAVCPLVGKLDRRDFAGPSLVALAWTRATPDLGVVASTLKHLPADCGSCTKCVDICPPRVPLLDLFAYANRKLGEVQAAKAGVLPNPPLRQLPSG